MDDDEDCVDVGNAFLDLRELLLTGNDVIEQQIDSMCCTWIKVFGGIFCKWINESCVGSDYNINY